MTTDRETIRPIGPPDDVCATAVAAREAAERCLHEAEALPDGAPEQLGVLLRGMLATQIATVEMLIAHTDRVDGWPATHGDWHVRNPGQRCEFGPDCDEA